MNLQSVTILKEKPPIFDAIRANGMNFNPATTIFTYGDAIYNPANVPLPPDLIVHEQVHMRQQREYNGGSDGWWARYLQDPLWRIMQEAEAYGAQYAWYVYNRKRSRDTQLRFLANIANSLASPMYGSQITPEEAVKLIRKEAGVQ